MRNSNNSQKSYQLVCPECHKKFMTTRKQRYCSVQCRTSRKRLQQKRRHLRNSINQIILSVFNHQCTICGCEEDLYIHHIIPLAKGGRNHIGNVTCLCKNCHRNTHYGLFQKTVEEWAGIQP